MVAFGAIAELAIARVSPSPRDHAPAQITRLGLSGIARHRYADFSKGAAAHPVDHITRLGLAGVARHRYASFSGKEAEDTSAHPVFHITRFGLSGIARHRYGSFAGKELEIIVVPEGNITDTDVILKPVDYALAGKQLVKDRFRTFEHSKGKESVKTRISGPRGGRLKGPKPSFTIKKGKL